MVVPVAWRRAATAGERGSNATPVRPSDMAAKRWQASQRKPAPKRGLKVLRRTSLGPMQPVPTAWAPYPRHRLRSRRLEIPCDSGSARTLGRCRRFSPSLTRNRWPGTPRAAPSLTRRQCRRDLIRGSVVYLLSGIEPKAHTGLQVLAFGGPMRDPHESPDPALTRCNRSREQPRPALDPADLGTAYGMELSIDSPAKQVPAEEDIDDPLGWIRRWVDQHKPG